MLISEYVNKNLQRYINQTKRCVREVIKGEDPEAVHDTRVAIRRIRAVLREVDNVYDKFYVKKLRTALKNIFNKFGPVRDMEVSNQILENLTISQPNKAEFNRWIKQRKKTEDELRQDVINVIENKELDEPLKILAAIMALPIKDSKDKTVEVFAFKKVNKIRSGVLKLGKSVLENFENPEPGHDLRILCKRLRYNIEFFKPVLPTSFPKIMRYAKKMQSTLGDMHDRDVIIEMMDDNLELSEGLKLEILNIVNAERADFAEKSKALTGKLPENI